MNSSLVFTTLSLLRSIGQLFYRLPFNFSFSNIPHNYVEVMHSLQKCQTGDVCASQWLYVLLLVALDWIRNVPQMSLCERLGPQLGATGKWWKLSEVGPMEGFRSLWVCRQRKK
jgi:hypothetical protein